MSTFYYVALICCLLGICQAQISLQCTLIVPTCDSSDDVCKSSTSTFQTCVSTQCDSQKMQQNDLTATLNCYNTICKSTYSPLLLEIMTNVLCLGNTVIGSYMQTLDQLTAAMSDGKCFSDMILSCQQTDECKTKLDQQMQCMETQCNISDKSTSKDLSEINKCISTQCQSSLDVLTQLNSKMINCSSTIINAQVTFSSILSGFIVVLSVFFLI